MSGALNSGMDILIELSAGFIARVVRQKLQDMDEGCLTADAVPIKDPRNPDNPPIPLDFRRIQLEISSLSFQQTLDGPVFIVLSANLLYAQVFWIDNTWKSLDEIEDILGVPVSRSLTTTLPLTISADPENILLSVDTTSVPYVPGDLGDPVSIPATFLNQTKAWVDEAGVDQAATLLALTINGEPSAKVLNANTLVIGLDVELTQDDPLLIPGPDVPDTEPVVAGANDLIAHTCGLPHQPPVDRLTFVTGFVDSFGNGNDWAIALDAHVLDAILRGAPAAGLNNAGEETEDCERKDSMLSACIQLDSPLEDDLINITGEALAYVCRPEFFIPNGYQQVHFRADVTLTVEGDWVRAHYEVTDVSLDILGSDTTDVLMWIAGEEFQRSDDQNAFRARFGSASDPAGRLTVEELSIRTDGLVLRGSSSLQPGYRSLSASDVLLFAKGCHPAGEPVIRFLRIRNNGEVNLHLCPLGIRRHPDGAEQDVELFRVTDPIELQDGGEPAPIEPGHSVLVTIECTGAAGAAYVAWLDIPNDAAVKSVRLDANFQPATLGELVDELDFGHIHYGWSGCNRPGDRSVEFDVELTNEGPGNMQLCSISFSGPLQQAFSATNPGVFAPGPANMRVTFVAPWGTDQDYDGTLEIKTNGNELRDIHIVASATTEQDPFGIFNHAGFDRDFACGDADWDRVQDTGGAILDSHEVAELLPILGGESCCPPPRGPACLCVDLWETAFFDVPAGVGLEVVNPEGQSIARSFPVGSVRTLVTPIRESAMYAMRASLPEDFATSQVSRMSTRRWIAQQDALYESSQRINDVTVAGDYAYAVGSRGLEVIRLSEAHHPERARLMRSLAGATSIAAVDDHVLVANDRVSLYSIKNPVRPRYASRLKSKSRIGSLATRDDSSVSRVVYGLGKRLHVLDVSDFDRPHEVGSIRLRGRAHHSASRGEFLYVFFANGIEVFSASDPYAPQSADFLPVSHEVKNGFVTGKSVVLVNGTGDVDIVDVSDPARMRLVGQLRMEEWMREFVPSAGRLPRYRNRFLALTPDQHGCRIVRIRANRVDQERLRRWRSERSRPTARAGF